MASNHTNPVPSLDRDLVAKTITMQLKLYLEIHYPSERHADVIRIAERSHIRVRRLQQAGTKTETILIADQCADLAKFGEFIGRESIPVVYHVENPSTPKRWNYVPEEKW